MTVMRVSLPRSAVLAMATIGLACADGGRGRNAAVARLRPASSDVRDGPLASGGARYVPVAMQRLAAEQRALVGGVRLRGGASGGVESAGDPLPAAPSETVELPQRLGGGFLFRMNGALYRAGDWLAPLEPIFASPPTSALTRIIVGLDRVYVQLAAGALIGLDPRTGHDIGLGPLPAGPSVNAFAALDGWRALAIVDARGLLATEDAGATWSPLAVAGEGAALTRIGDLIAARPADPSRGPTQWFGATSDGHIERASPPPTSQKAVGESDDDARLAASTGGGKPFGLRPLGAAIEDGWPMADGTALIARDGALGRVRLSDGVVTATSPDAFALTPARCHGVSLARPYAPRAFGFVCGQPHGCTDLYAFDPARGALALLKRFDNPRQVSASANGGLVVRGACAADAPSDDAGPGQQTYCVRGPDDVFRDFYVRGDIGSERVVALADGRTAVVSPPQGNLASARLTLFGSGGASTVAVTFDPEPAPTTPDDLRDAQALTRALRQGAWLGGFEERRPGFLSGWVMSGSTAIGIEISLDGRAKHGAFVRDLGAPVVSGAFGIGWGSRRGYETTDGGVTWRLIELPEPLAASAQDEGVRSCGPLGCEAVGWLRVGWGPRASQLETLPASPIAAPPPPQRPLVLHCNIELSGAASLTEVAATSTRNWLSFFNVPAPHLAADDAAYGLDGSALLERGRGDATVRGLAHLYAWGPRSASDWEALGHAIIRFASPFDSSAHARSTQRSAIPHFVADAFIPTLAQARATVALQSAGLAFSDDGDEAIWVIQRYGPRSEMAGALLLQADRPIVEIRRADGEPLPSVEAAVHVGERWYLATAAGSSGAAATVIWEVDSGLARELARLPRVGLGPTPGAVRLARGEGSASIGVVIDGQPGAARYSSAQRWVVPIDLASATVRPPELLGNFDLANSATPCGADGGGWALDTAWKNPLQLDVAGVSIRGAATLARIHLRSGSSCVERVASTDGAGEEIAHTFRSPDRATTQTALAAATAITVVGDGARTLLRCAP
jgi:hypothetical protein